METCSCSQRRTGAVQRAALNKEVSKQNYTMLDNLKLGYGGTKEEMERLLDDAEKLTGKKFDIENFSDVVTAVDAIQKSMDIAGTTQDEAAKTIEGSIAMTKAAWTNFLTGLADEDADMEQLTQNLVDSAMKAASNIIPRLGTIVGTIVQQLPGLLQQYGPQLVEALRGYIGEALGNIGGDFPQLGKAFEAFEQQIGPMSEDFKAIADAVKPVAETWLPILGDMFEQVAPVAAEFMGGVADTARKIVEELAPALQDFGNQFNDNVMPIFSFMMESGLPSIGSVLSGMMQGLGGGLADIIGMVSHPFQVVKGLLPAFVGEFKTRFALLGSVVKTRVGQAKTALQGMVTAVNGIKTKIKNGIDKIKGFFSNLKLKIPKIKMPHIPKMSVSWTSDFRVGKGGLKIKVPIPHISWNAAGGVFDAASIIGYGVGERGAEAVLPLTNPRTMSMVGNAIAAGMPNGGGTYNIYVTTAATDPSAVANEIARSMRQRNMMRG